MGYGYVITVFSGERYISFKEKAVFSLEPSKDREHPENISQMGGYKGLKVAATYGANASGKTNFFKAITIALLMIRLKKALDEGRTIMIDMTCNIIPYVGVGSIKLGMSLESVRNLLKNQHTGFEQWVEPNKGLDPEVPWVFIKIDKSIVLTFAKDVLFEISLENKYQGKLPNGIGIDMKMTDAEQIDQTLEYNDEDEDFVSKDGYWLGDLAETGRIITITIFLPEVENDNFFEYEWVSKYIE